MTNSNELMQITAANEIATPEMKMIVFWDVAP
jgi:hypothetical protein